MFINIIEYHTIATSGQLNLIVHPLIEVMPIIGRHLHITNSIPAITAIDNIAHSTIAAAIMKKSSTVIFLPFRMADTRLITISSTHVSAKQSMQIS